MGLTTGGTIGARSGISLDEAVERVQALRRRGARGQPRHPLPVPRRPDRRARRRAVRPRAHHRHRRLLRRLEHGAPADRGGHDGEHAALQVHPDPGDSMSGRFITQGDIVRDQFDWGEAGWVSRPEFTGSRAMCVMDVTLQPGRGPPLPPPPRPGGDHLGARGARRAVARGRQAASSGPARRSTSRRTSSTAPTRVGDEPAKLTVILTPDRGRGRLRGHRRLRGGALGVAALSARARAASEQPLEVLRGAFEVDRVSAGAHRPRGEPLRDRGRRRAPSCSRPARSCR